MCPIREISPHFLTPSRIRIASFFLFWGQLTIVKCMYCLTSIWHVDRGSFDLLLVPRTAYSHCRPLVTEAPLALPHCLYSILVILQLPRNPSRILKPFTHTVPQKPARDFKDYVMSISVMWKHLRFLLAIEEKTFPLCM